MSFFYLTIFIPDVGTSLCEVSAKGNKLLFCFTEHYHRLIPETSHSDVPTTVKQILTN